MADIIKPRETWFVTNTTKKTLTINDLPSIPIFKPGDRIDVLKYVSSYSLTYSLIFNNYINKKWLVPDNYLHTHDDKSYITHKLESHPDVKATATQVNTLVAGKTSNADKLHTHDLETDIDHNKLENLQGGKKDEYYHFIKEDYEKLKAISTDIKFSDLKTLTAGRKSNADLLHSHSVDYSLLDHNELTGLQGGSSSDDDFYHLDEVLYTYLSNVTASYTEINQALDGISAKVTYFNLNILTAGPESDADHLHTHSLANIYDHNDLKGLQGGNISNDEFYHLDLDDFTKVVTNTFPHLTITGDLIVEGTTTFSVSHNDLAGLQGGNISNDEFYHLDLDDFIKVVDNTFPHLTITGDLVVGGDITFSGTIHLYHNNLLGLQGGNVSNDEMYHFDENDYLRLEDFANYINLSDTTMLSLEYSDDSNNSTIYFIDGKFDSSGDTTAGGKYTFGYSLDLNISGNHTGGVVGSHTGYYVDLDDTSVVNHAGADHYVYGYYADVNWAGTNTDNDLIQLYGMLVNVTGNIGTTGGTTHRGHDVWVSGTADNNYGIYISQVQNGTFNYGIWDASGADWVLDADDQKIYFGGAQDAYIEFDGNSLNIVANIITGTDDLEMTADVIQMIATTGVGIGTATPEYSLDVNGSVRITEDLIVENDFIIKGDIGIKGRLYFGGNKESYIYYDENSGDLNFEMANPSIEGRFIFNDEIEATSVNITDEELGYQIDGVTILTKKNVGSLLIGNEAGQNLTTPDQNILIGFRAGRDITTEDGNVIIGYSSGSSLTNGEYNTVIGNNAAVAGGAEYEWSVIIGYRAGYDLTTANNSVIIGYNAGQNITNSGGNVIIGSQAGNEATGAENTIVGRAAGLGSAGNSAYANSVLIGYQSGHDLEDGVDNTIIGHDAGFNLTDSGDNVIIGSAAGYESTGARNAIFGKGSGYGSPGASSYQDNVLIGYQTGYDITSGSYNVFIGGYAGFEQTTGGNNVVIGYQSGYGQPGSSTYTNSVFVGLYAGQSVTTGDNNTYVGMDAGQHTSTGSGNVCLGYMAGEGWLIAQSNLLVIANSNTATPLIYGDFSVPSLTINGDLIVTGDTIYEGDTIFEGDLWLDSSDGILYFGENKEVRLYYDGIDFRIDSTNPSIPGNIFLDDNTIINGRLDVFGDTQLGDTAEGHTVGINTAPVDAQLITANLTESNQVNSYFIRGTHNASGDDNYNTYGYYLDLNVSGTHNQWFTTKNTYGVHIDLDDDTDISDFDASLNTHGGYFDVNYTGAITIAATVWMDAIYATATGDMGVAMSWGGKTGLRVNVEGTARSNYGIYIAQVTGATTNYGIWDASGADWALDADSQKIWFGEGQDSYIEFDGNSMNIIANAVTATDDIIISADNFSVDATGDLYFKGDLWLNSSDGILYFGENKEVRLYYDGEDFRIDSTNPSIPGNIFLDDDVTVGHDLFVLGNTQLGDTVEGDTVGINTAPVASQLITANLTESTEATAYFVRGTFNHSANIVGFGPPPSDTYGYYLDLNTSGTHTGAFGIKTVYGVHIDLDDETDINEADAELHLRGGYFNVNYNGTITIANEVWLDGLYSVVTGDFGAFGASPGNKDGLRVDVSGTGTNNYGIYISQVTGATNDYGIWDASGADWVLDSDSQKIYFGESQDAYIEYQNGVGLAIIDGTTGTITLGDDNLITTGTISGVNVTSGIDPGHTHTGSPISDHNDLLRLQGGNASNDEFYHLDLDDYLLFMEGKLGEIIEHNSLLNLQGGNVSNDEFYHLDLDNFTELVNWIDDVILGADGSFTTPGDIILNSNTSKLYFGNEQQAFIYFDGTDLRIESSNPSRAGVVRINDDLTVDLDITIKSGQKLILDGE